MRPASEWLNPLGTDPADLVAAQASAAERVARLVAALRADWMRDALCAEFDTDLWFPSIGQSNQPALDICGRCPVRGDCLDEALNDRDLDHGIRGGASARARKVMRRSRSRLSEPAA